MKILLKRILDHKVDFALAILSSHFSCDASVEAVGEHILLRFDSVVTSEELVQSFNVTVTYIDRGDTTYGVARREYAIISSSSVGYGAIVAYLHICKAYGHLL